MGGGPGSGISKARLLALRTTQERGWGVGTVLVSESWGTLRKITRLSGRRVELTSIGSRSERVFVHTFPTDVREPPRANSAPED